MYNNYKVNEIQTKLQVIENITVISYNRQYRYYLNHFCMRDGKFEANTLAS